MLLRLRRSAPAAEVQHGGGEAAQIQHGGGEGQQLQQRQHAVLPHARQQRQRRRQCAEGRGALRCAAVSALSTLASHALAEPHMHLLLVRLNLINFSWVASQRAHAPLFGKSGQEHFVA